MGRDYTRRCRRFFYLVLIISFFAPDAFAMRVCGRQISRRAMMIGAGVSAGGVGIGAPTTFMAGSWLMREPDFLVTRNFTEGSVGKTGLSIATFGDSIMSDWAWGNTSFLGSKPGGKEIATIWRARTKRGGWPFQLFSLLTAADPQIKLRVTNFARGGAYIDPAINESKAVKIWMNNTNDLQAQVGDLLERVKSKSMAFPNKIQLNIGATNTDWKWDVELRDLDEESYRQDLPQITTDYLNVQVQRLRKAARAQPYPVTIIVTGIINYPAVFEARRQAEKLRDKDPSLYPAWEKMAETFPSLLPEHQAKTLVVWREMNRLQKLMVERINASDPNSSVKIYYDDCFETGPFQNVNFLDDSDAMHPSLVGRWRLAQSIRDSAIFRRALRDLGFPQF